MQFNILFILLLIIICLFLFKNNNIIEGMTDPATNLKPMDGCAFNSKNIFGGTSKTLVDGDCQICQGAVDLDDKTINKKYNCPNGFKVCGGKPININYYDQHCIPTKFKPTNSCLYNESIPATLPYVNHNGDPTDKANDNGKPNWVRCEYAYNHNNDNINTKGLLQNSNKNPMHIHHNDKNKYGLKGWNQEYYLDYGAPIKYDDKNIIPDHISKHNYSQQYNSELYPQYYAQHDEGNEVSTHHLNSKQYTMHHRNQINKYQNDITKLKCECKQKKRQYPVPSHDTYNKCKKGNSKIHSTNYRYLT